MWLTLLEVFASVLTASPLVPQALKQGIEDSLAAIGGIVSSGAVSDPSPATIMQAMLNTLTALKADPNLPAEMLDQITNLITIVQQTLAADAQAQTGVDESKLNEIEPLP